MSNEKNLPYAVVCGGVNIDIGAHSFAPLRAKDSNPGKVELSLGGVGRNIAHNMRLLGVPTYLLTAVGGDSRASQVEESCKELGIDLSHALRVPDGRTSTYVFVGDSDGDMAVAVAEMPGKAHLNPLFIYGDSGLGKTHLLTAIQTEIKRTHPDFVIMYVTCEQFTNELIAAIRAGSTEDFRMKYRVADLLLVDDIQFIAGKESTQEEFFHTFNSLHDAHKQIVIASDRPAKEIKSLEERLRTRFEWGLTADVQPPDFETRVAIVKRKAELLHLDLPEDVAEFIANHLKNNIRQLEGAVKKLNAYYMLEGIQPVISVAQNAIKDILNETQPVPVTIEKIVGEVSRTFNVSPADIRGTKRNANVASARRVAIYILREVTGMSMEEIGREFSGRDHSTIVYSLKTMERDMKNDQHLRETVSDIIKNVKA